MRVGSLQHLYIRAVREHYAGFLCEADLEDYLVKRYEADVGGKVIELSLDIAPKYAEWMILQNRQRNLRVTPGTRDEIKETLETFDKIKKMPEFKEAVKEYGVYFSGNPSDINSYRTWDDLQEVVIDLADVKSRTETLREKIKEGYSVVAERGQYKLYEITNAEASVALCKGMGWCTHAPDTAKEYTDRGPLYMAVHSKGGAEYLAHFESNELQDASRNAVTAQELPYEVYNMFADAGFEDEINSFGPTEEQQRETWIERSIEEISSDLRGHGERDLSDMGLPAFDSPTAERVAGEVFDLLVRKYPGLAEDWDLDGEGYPYGISPSLEEYTDVLTVLGYIEMTEEERRKRGPPGPGYWQDPGYDPEKAFWWSQYEEQQPLGLQARYVHAVREHYAGFLCQADLKEYLVKDYEAKVGMAVIDKAIEIAPKYAERIIIWNINDPSMDITRESWVASVEESLKIFEKIKKVKEFKDAAIENFNKWISGNPSDINSYNQWGQFSAVVHELEDVKSKAATLRDKIKEGYTQLAEEGGWSVYELTNQEATTALCKSLDWCVKDPAYGEQYLKEDSLYMVVAGDSPEYLIHLKGIEGGEPEMQDANRDEVSWYDLSGGAQAVLTKAKMAGTVEELFPGEDPEEEEEESEEEREAAEERRREDNYESSIIATYDHLENEYRDIALVQDWNAVMQRLEQSPYYMEYDYEDGDGIEPPRDEVIEVLAELDSLDEEYIWEASDENTIRRIRERAQASGPQLQSWTDWSQGPLVREDVPGDFDEQMFAWLLQNHPDQVREESVLEAASDLSGVIPGSEYVALAAVTLGFATPQAVQLYNIVFRGEEEEPTGPAYYEQPGYAPPPEDFVSPYEEQPELGLQASKLALAILRGELVA